LDIPLFSRG